jgi:hypothetical protein
LTREPAMRRTVLLTAFALCLMGSSAAQATPLTAVDYNGRCVDQNQSINAQIAAHQGNVLRLVVNPNHYGQGLECVRAASAGGYKVYLSLQYPNLDTPAQVASVFANELPQYQAAAGGLWAVSVGNEPDLDYGGTPTGWRQICATSSSPQAYLEHAAFTTYTTAQHTVRRHVRVLSVIRRHHHSKRAWRWRWRTFRSRLQIPHRHAAVYGTRDVQSPSCRPTNSGEDYDMIWNAVVPVLNREAPGAIHVFAEGCPCGGEQFVKQAIAAGAPSEIGAVSFHCYHMTSGGGLDAVPEFSAWLARYGLPLWCSEMAPALNGTYSFLVHESQADYDREVSAVLAVSPNMQMLAYYDWNI